MPHSLSADQASDAATGRLRGLGRRLGAFKERRALKAARWAADAELLRRTTPPLRLAWRVEELVEPKNRLGLARSIRQLVHDSAARYLPSASPLNRLAVRAESESLHALADRLADLDRTVAPRGVLLVERLLTDGFSPLYERESSDDLPPYLDIALAALEPR
jgi:hypothetical protein